MHRNVGGLGGFGGVPVRSVGPSQPILIGRIDSVELDRDIYQTTLEARYGLHDRIEMSASIAGK